ncbi:hypothetical protein [Pseudomonas sp. HPB0071]
METKNNNHKVLKVWIVQHDTDVVGGWLHNKV